jgi:membrane-associated phospholipid phosphatase
VNAPVADALDFGGAARLFKRQRTVPVAFVILCAIAPLYLFLPGMMHGREFHSPELAIDRMLPLRPEWSAVYGSLFCAVILPAFVVHQHDLLRRTIHAFLMAWLIAFAVFIAYPTVGPQHPKVAVHGFADWGLRTIYGADVNYNCFPSLHVAQAFLAAFACHRVHRAVGTVTFAWASLLSLSTLLTKQHYFVDVVGGIALACLAQLVFMRGFPPESIPADERRLAPLLAAGAFAVYGVMLGILLCPYLLGMET